MDWLTIAPPIIALGVALWTRNVYWALALAIIVSETLIAGFNPGVGLLGGIDRIVGVFGSTGNTRILLFCLIIGALIAYMQRSGGIMAMVEWLHGKNLASTPRRAGVVTALAGIVLFIETNVSLLASGILGRPLFDRLQLSRERLAFIIDSTCAPVSVLILFNGWGAYIAGLMASNGVDNAFDVLFQTIGFNFYPLLILAIVFATLFADRTFGALGRVDRNWQAPQEALENSAPAATPAEETPSRAAYMGVPVAILVGGALGFMIWTGDGDITSGSGSQSILWAVVLATGVAALYLWRTGRAAGQVMTVGFNGMGELLPAVMVVLLALALGNSLSALGTGAFIASTAASIPAPFLIPALLFVIAGITSFTTGTSWGTYGILIPLAIPMALGAELPIALVVAAVMGGGVFGDHCSPISDTTIIASLAARCDHMDHVRTQLPYALVGGGLSIAVYVIAALLIAA